MSQALTWNQFRSLHKGTPKNELSELWSKYKEGTYSFPVEDTSPEEVIGELDSPAEVVEAESSEATIEDTSEEITEIAESPWEALKKISRECEYITRQLTDLAHKYSEEELRTMNLRLMEISELTMPRGYVCTPTDSWKLWFGPTQFCLLLNTTRQVAFGISRGWWRAHYQNTVYVDREVLNNNEFILAQVEGLKRRNRYTPRPPIVGLECKLPQGVKDIQLRGGQGQDR
jgi:hypothetical protein